MHSGADWPENQHYPRNNHGPKNRARKREREKKKRKINGEALQRDIDRSFNCAFYGQLSRQTAVPRCFQNVNPRGLPPARAEGGRWRFFPSVPLRSHNRGGVGSGEIRTRTFSPGPLGNTGNPAGVINIRHVQPVLAVLLATGHAPPSPPHPTLPLLSSPPAARR